VSSHRLGQGEKDLALLDAAVLGQVAVDGCLGTFVGEVLPPPLDVRGAVDCGVRCSGGRRVAGFVAWFVVERVRWGVLGHGSSWA
jgi:hypothetical protein